MTLQLHQLQDLRAITGMQRVACVDLKKRLLRLRVALQNHLNVTIERGCRIVQQ